MGRGQEARRSECNCGAWDCWEHSTVTNQEGKMEKSRLLQEDVFCLEHVAGVYGLAITISHLEMKV